MAGCQEPECQRQVREMYQDIYGHQGSGNGIKNSINSLKEIMPGKIEKKSVLTIFALIILPVAIALTAAGLNVWAMQYVYPHKFASKEDVNDQDRRVIVLEESYKSIARQLNDLGDIKETNRLILKALEELKQQQHGNRSGKERPFYQP